MPTLIIRERATPSQVSEMLKEYDTMIKIVVDTRRKILAGGGEMHYDCETALIDDESAQVDLWGANWYPHEQRIEFESLINVRPRQSNPSILIQSEEIRRAVEEITRRFLEGVK